MAEMQKQAKDSVCGIARKNIDEVAVFDRLWPEIRKYMAAAAAKEGFVVYEGNSKMAYANDESEGAKLSFSFTDSYICDAHGMATQSRMEGKLSVLSGRAVLSYIEADTGGHVEVRVEGYLHSKDNDDLAASVLRTALEGIKSVAWNMREECLELSDSLNKNI
jgi:hypothetical protein